MSLSLGSVYLIVDDFERTLDFYERLLQREVSSRNSSRFAQFVFDGHNISIMNAHYDHDHPEKSEHKGEYIKEIDDLITISSAPNTHKFVLNFWSDDLDKERRRILSLGISSFVSSIKYVNHVMPYYYIQVLDPDGNVIEIAGNYREE